MCEACLALARLRSGAPAQAGSEGQAKRSPRFAGVAEWADAPSGDEARAGGPAAAEEPPPVDAERG
jgi:hypothetical protein